MKKTIFAAIATAMIAASTSAYADDEDCGPAAKGPWMDRQAVEAKLVEQGYKVRRIKSDEGCYEAYAFDRDGKRVEISLDPISGETRKVEYDD